MAMPNATGYAQQTDATLAKGARNWADRSMLEDLAAELEVEANRIDDEEEPGPTPMIANEP